MPLAFQVSLLIEYMGITRLGPACLFLGQKAGGEVGNLGQPSVLEPEAGGMIVFYEDPGYRWTWQGDHEDTTKMTTFRHGFSLGHRFLKSLDHISAITVRTT